MTTRRDAWQWVAYEVREEIDPSDWQHVECVRNIHHRFLEVLREMAHCEHPAYSPSPVAGELTQLHHVAAPRRIERHDWTLDLPPFSD